MAFFVTHYVPDDPPTRGLRRISFLTTTEDPNDELYYMGYELGRGFTEKDLEPKLESGGVVRITVPHKIDKDQGVWMDENHAIWIADYHNPLGDLPREKIFEYRG